MVNTIHFTDEQIKEALKASGGLITKAAELIGCDHSTVSRRTAANPELQQVIKDAREKHIDSAENSLRYLVEKKDLGAVCFSLKTIGKHRGYTEHNLVQTEESLRQATAELAKIAAFLAPSPLPSKDKEP